MNKIVLVGRLIRDPELRIVEGTEKCFTKFIIAVERSFKTASGERQSDLIPVTMWGRKAEVACQYLHRGSTISLSGRLRTGSYEDSEGNKKYIAQVVAEDFRFVNSQKYEPNKDNLNNENNIGE